MMSGNNEIQTEAERWLSLLEEALKKPGVPAIEHLFAAECHWRDILVLDSDIMTANGVDEIKALFARDPERKRPSNFRLAQGRTPPRQLVRSGVEVIEFLFECDSEWGPAAGLGRLVESPDGAGYMGYTCMIALQELDRRYQDIGRYAIPDFARKFGDENWKAHRDRMRSYVDHDPAVLVIGGSQAGLAIASRLTHMGIDTLVIDRQARTGDNWRERYDALVLHNQTNMNHLPHMNFPDSWPNFLPKDKLANWFEIYEEAMELNVWTSTQVSYGSYDEAGNSWAITLTVAGENQHHIRPKHVIFATGTSSIPVVPELPGLDQFKGSHLHSSQHKTGAGWAGKTAVVVGTGNSAHDVAQDLASHGAKVTMVQRSATYIISLEEAQKLFTLYNEGLPVEDADMIASGTPFRMLLKACQQLTADARIADKPLLDGLEARGFRLNYGEEGGGFQPMILRKAGGYCFNVGCSDLIVDGTIGVVNASDISSYGPDGLHFKDGSILPADLMILATGYRSQQDTVRAILGDEVADKVGPVWDLDKTDELRNMWRPTAQKGLWFTGGGLGQCRIYSKYLGLQIKRQLALDVAAAKKRGDFNSPVRASLTLKGCTVQKGKSGLS
ncbi:flavin-containing monooxygenase [Paraburkholderia sp.]|uniref:flavin-containing monooxygenase n=1 Tax=Paraburkholderia sp. TaxID=1926495 RepID=UPI0039E4C73D